MLGAIDAIGLFTTIPDFPEGETLPSSSIGPGSDSSTVDTTASLVTHPTTLTPEVEALGVNDLDQLVHDYSTYGSVCDTEEGWAYFLNNSRK